MRILKKLLLVLLVLVTITQFFNYPGVNSLSFFHQNGDSIFASLNKFPPFLYLLIIKLSNFFPVTPEGYFYKSSLWITMKGLIFAAYIFLLPCIIYLSKIKNSTKSDWLDISLFYFGSVAILLGSVSLYFFEILSLPFFVASLIAIKKDKKILCILFFLTAIFLNWHILLFLPVFVRYLTKSKVAIWISLFLLVVSFNFSIFDSIQKSGVFSLDWLISYTTKTYIDTKLQFGWLSYPAYAITFLVSLFLIYKTVSKVISKNYFVGQVVFVAVSLAAAIFLKNLQILFLIIFFTLYIKFIYQTRFGKIKFNTFVVLLLSVNFVYLVFGSEIPNGFLVVQVVLSLILHIHTRNKISTLILLSTNIMTFVNLFFVFGNSGIKSIRGEYFMFALIPVASLILVYYLKLVNLFFESNLKFPIKKRGLNFSTQKIRPFAVALMIVINFSLLTANGTSDRVAWSEYAVAASQNPNPFVAQTTVDQRYPPLSTAIMSIFTNAWKYTVGFRDYGNNFYVSPDYAQSIKVSVFFFYFLSVLVLYKLPTKKQLSKKCEKLLVILTVFSLVIQTQGFGDVNIYLVPSMIISMLALYKNKLFWSGFLMGVTLSIKWQPVILLPLFAVSLIDKNSFKDTIQNVLKFGFGFAIIPIVSWWLVLIEPGGRDAFIRATDYLIQGAPKLSGQALNLNWIVTYFVHIYQPWKDVSLEHLEGLNRQIDTNMAPLIFQGYLFIVAVIVLVYNFFRYHKKNLGTFVSGCFMIFFSHQMLNKSAYEKHLFYSVLFVLVFYLLRPSKGNKVLLLLLDLMTVMNLIFFYGFVGPKDVNRMFLSLDLTVIFSAYYLVVYAYVFFIYIKTKGELFTRKFPV